MACRFLVTPILDVPNATQKVMMQAAGQLDWIGGFSNDPGKPLHLEAHLAPVLRCYVPLRRIGKTMPICQAIARTESRRVITPILLRKLGGMHTGSIYSLRKLSHVRGSAEATVIGQQRRHADQVDIAFRLSDDKITVAPFRDIKQAKPDVARVIEAWQGPCPDSVAFFIAEDGSTTIAIPTAHILREYYCPQGNALEEFLTASDATAFVGRFAAFDGFRYVSLADEIVRCYPIRSQRNIERAEHEISQLLPRAAAYYSRHKVLPVLIRPPFVGDVRIQGVTVSASPTSDRRLLFFPHGARFGPENKQSPANLRSRSLSFAPTFDSVNVRLTEIDAAASRDHDCSRNVLTLQYLEHASRMVRSGNIEWCSAARERFLVKKVSWTEVAPRL